MQQVGDRKRHFAVEERHIKTPKYKTNPGHLGHVVEEQLKGLAETRKVKK